MKVFLCVANLGKEQQQNNGDGMERIYKPFFDLYLLMYLRD